MADAGLDHLAPWLEGYLQRLAPSERRKLTRRLAKALRDANARRIRDNVEPDGTPMQPRKSKRDRRGRLRKRKGRMFPKTSLPQPALQSSAHEVWCPSGTDGRHRSSAPVRQAPVDPRIPNSIKVRYPARRLLGLAPDDIAMIEADTLGLLE
jgi:phage virion morphogenesis protein